MRRDDSIVSSPSEFLVGWGGREADEGCRVQQEVVKGAPAFPIFGVSRFTVVPTVDRLPTIFACQ
jgi:hypothetical protein